MLSFLRLPIVPRSLLAERALAAQEARRHMAKHQAQVRVKRALQHQTPQATDQIYQPDDKVLVWREKLVENRIGELIGPYTVCSYDAEALIVLVRKEPDAPHERYNVAQVRPFLEKNRRGESLHKFYRLGVEPIHYTPTLPAHMIEFTEKNDPRADSPRMRRAISNEVRELLRRGTFSAMLKTELPDGANALTARFVLTVKFHADVKTKYKARYVIGGHRDNLKHYLVHVAQTPQASSARLLLALASANSFQVWSSDIKQAYLQSIEPLTRRVFIKNPAPEFELEPDQCFELLKTSYGLSDAEDLWHMAFHKYLTQDPTLEPTKSDPSLYFTFRRGELTGINGTYVDVLLRAGTYEFKEISQNTPRRFETSADEDAPFTLRWFYRFKSPRRLANNG